MSDTLETQARAIALEKRGIAHRALGNSEQSIVDLGASIALSQDTSVMRMLAWTYREAKRYEDAEARRADALATWLHLQESMQQIDSGSQSGARMGQINALESERQQLGLVLQSRLNVERPSEIQVQALRDQIANIDALIAELREELTGSDGNGASLASRNTELRVAEENYNFQTAKVQQALTQMETARIEANRQVRYLSQSVNPVIPDQAAYPRAFENTLLALLIFSGIYLLISITVSILREQVSS